MARLDTRSAAQFSLSDLLEETGVQSSAGCKIIISKVSALLSENYSFFDSECLGEKQVRTNLQTLSQYLCSLLVVLPQLLCEDEGSGDIADTVVCDVIDPYLDFLATVVEENEFISSCNSTIWSVASLLLQSKNVLKACGPCILSTFSKLLEKLCKGNASMYDGYCTANATPIISVIAHALNKAGPIEIERSGLSLAGLFDGSLRVLKEADLRTCYVICSTLLPLLVAGDPAGRSNQLWKFVKDVHSQAVCVTSLGSDLILAIFCCLSDMFLYSNMSSPFSVLCRAPGNGAAELALDLRWEDQFWEIVQGGLVSHDAQARKQAMYLVRSVLESVQGSKAGDVVVTSKKHVFWWSQDCEVTLKKAWDDLVLILETMEEKQIHIVQPVRAHLKSVITAAATKCPNGHYVLHLSWQFVALSRVFQHTEAKSVIKWGVQECLQMNLDQSPLQLRENWKFIFEQLLEVLNETMLYGKGQSEEIAQVLTSFFQRFVAGLDSEDKGDFLESLFAAMDSKNLADVPLVFLTYSLAQLPEKSLLGPCTLGFIRSIILNGILTHKPYLRAAAQHFLLMVVSILSNTNMLSYDDVIRTLGSFRESECLIMGTESWNRAYSFFAKFCLVKMEENPSQSIVDYFKLCIRNYLASSKKTTEEHEEVPSHVHLTRALVLLVEGENREGQQSPRVLSSDVKSLSEMLAVLLDPVLETAAMAGQRPYLSPDVATISLEVITVAAKLIVNRRKGSTEEGDPTSLLYGVMADYLPSILRHTIDQLFLGCEVSKINILE